MRLIIVHRWDGSPEADWYPWLRREAERRGLSVQVPALPEPDYPRIEPWVRTLRSLRPDQDTILVGHSLGCQTILRALDRPVRGAVFVAGFFALHDLEGPESEEIAAPWVAPFPLARAKASLPKLTVLLSDNDPWVDPEENGRLFRDRLGAEVIVLGSRGHFTGEDHVLKLPEALRAVEAMAR
ncbi:MAG: serine hydrolase family protein [Candidatus Aenigmarchaeota archaeon]|nr:serine hydrolase family protein [Candidatus Aenigmarchaeota archaeon]